MKVSSLSLSENFRCRLERKSLPTLMLLAVVLVPLLVASLYWVFYRYHISSAAKGVTAAQSSASPSKSQQTAPIDERLSNAERAIMFSIAPLTSPPAVMTPVDPDPVASFRQLLRCRPGVRVKRLALIRAGYARSSIAGWSSTRLPKPMETGQEVRA